MRTVHLPKTPEEWIRRGETGGGRGFQKGLWQGEQADDGLLEEEGQDDRTEQQELVTLQVQCGLLKE